MCTAAVCRSHASRECLERRDTRDQSRVRSPRQTPARVQTRHSRDTRDSICMAVRVTTHTAQSHDLTALCTHTRTHGTRITVACSRPVERISHIRSTHCGRRILYSMLEMRIPTSAPRLLPRLNRNRRPRHQCRTLRRRQAPPRVYLGFGLEFGLAPAAHVEVSLTPR